MKLFWQQHKIIILFFLGLTCLTVGSYIGNFQSEEPAKPLANILTEPATLVKIEKTTSSRQPASTSTETSVHDKKLSFVLFCNSRILNGEAHAQMLMLELTSCHELKEKQLISVKNLTNGFKAQIFKVAGQKFKTDFIQLSPGKNVITVDGVLKDGQIIKQTLEILSAS